MTARDLVIGVDVGGTTVKAALFDSDGLDYCSSERPTPRHLGPDAVIETAIHAIAELQAQVPEADRVTGCGPCGSRGRGRGARNRCLRREHRLAALAPSPDSGGCSRSAGGRRPRRKGCRAGRARVGRRARLAGDALRRVRHRYCGGRDHERASCRPVRRAGLVNSATSRYFRKGNGAPAGNADAPRPTPALLPCHADIPLLVASATFPLKRSSAGLQPATP